MIFSILVFASVSSQWPYKEHCLPTVAHKLAMIDDNDNVLKTFTDYQEEEHLPLAPNLYHPARITGQIVKFSELNLSDTLILMIKRNEQTINSEWSNIILPGDQLVVSGTGFHEQTDLTLNEINIDKNHPWLSKEIKDLNLPPQTLIILIKRQGWNKHHSKRGYTYPTRRYHCSNL